MQGFFSHVKCVAALTFPRSKYSPTYYSVPSALILVKLKTHICLPNHFLYPVLLCSCQPCPPWAACQRCHPGLLKRLPARREQLYPSTDSRQMVVSGEECCITKPLFCGCSLCFQVLKLCYLCDAPPAPVVLLSIVSVKPSTLKASPRSSDPACIVVGSSHELCQILQQTYGLYMALPLKDILEKPFQVLLLKHNPFTQEIRLASRVRNPRIVFHSWGFYLWSLSLCCIFLFSTPFSLQ